MQQRDSHSQDNDQQKQPIDRTAQFNQLTTPIEFADACEKEAQAKALDPRPANEPAFGSLERACAGATIRKLRSMLETFPEYGSQLGVAESAIRSLVQPVAEKRSLDELQLFLELADTMMEKDGSPLSLDVVLEQQAAILRNRGFLEQAAAIRCSLKQFPKKK